MKKHVLIASMMGASMAATAESEINYNYLELGYGVVDLGGSNPDGFYFDASAALTDSFYLGAAFDQKEGRNSEFDRYGLRLGFHKGISQRTDFYSELEVGQFENRFNDSFSFGLFAGTRTAFTEHFELISKVGYTEVDDANDGYYEVELKGLFKFNDSNGITAGLESLDGNFGASVGYRYSF